MAAEEKQWHRELCQNGRSWPGQRSQKQLSTLPPNVTPKDHRETEMGCRPLCFPPMFVQNISVKLCQRAGAAAPTGRLSSLSGISESLYSICKMLQPLPIYSTAVYWSLGTICHISHHTQGRAVHLSIWGKIISIMKGSDFFFFYFESSCWDCWH